MRLPLPVAIDAEPDLGGTLGLLGGNGESDAEGADTRRRIAIYGALDSLY
jgi:hypothetical protein